MMTKWFKILLLILGFVLIALLTAIYLDSLEEVSSVTPAPLSFLSFSIQTSENCY